MANTADVRTKLQIFLQKQASSYVISTLFPVMPVMGWLWAFNGDKTGHKGLGVPSADGVIASKIPSAHARKQSMMNARQYMPLVATSVPTENDIKAMTDYDTEPVVSDAEDNAILNRFTQPVFKFTRQKMPCSVWKSDVRTAKGSGNGVEAQAGAAVGSVFDAETKMRMGSLGSKLNKTLYEKAGSATGVPSDETASQWSQFHSLKAAASSTNIYAGTDRSLSANSFWQGTTVTTATSQSFEDFVNYANYDLGFADVGLGANLIVVGRTGFKAAKKEFKAEAGAIINNDKIPEMAEWGVVKEAVRISSGGQYVYVIFDPTCPDQTDTGGVNHVYTLNTNVWTTAVAPDGNFAISKPADQGEVEGGREAFIWNVQAELLLACEDPKHGIVCHTNVTF